MSKEESKSRSDEAVRDALDHIMRVARQGISPTQRLDWIEIRARYALEGKPWSPDIRETPRDSVKKMEKDFAKCRADLAAVRSEQRQNDARYRFLRDNYPRMIISICCGTYEGQTIEEAEVRLDKSIARGRNDDEQFERSDSC